MNNQLNTYLTQGQRALGKQKKREGISSSLGPFTVIDDMQVRYPSSVIEALGVIYKKYNQVFTGMVAENREWESDYRLCLEKGESPLNFFVQIDMVGLPEGFLEEAASMQVGELVKILEAGIFEIENSLAMYQLLRRIFPGKTFAFFKSNFDRSLQELRKRCRKRIALLATNEQKYCSMKESEFGKQPDEDLTNEEVKELSGFDKFFSPNEFIEYLEQNGWKCHYALYVRSSAPTKKLANPETEVDEPLLADPKIREIIKEHAVTLNVDDPDADFHKRINDSKAYMAPLGLGYDLYKLQDIFDQSLIDHLQSGKPFDQHYGAYLNHSFISFLISRGVDPKEIISGEVSLRLKPMKGAYGCYGHLHGPLTDRRVRSELKKNLKKRGAYVVQPEIPSPIVVDSETKTTFTYIDRIFMSCTSGNPRFLGGFRSMMPLNTMEAKKGRNHGNSSTVWVEIT